MVKYYMASKGTYASSMKLLNCLIALIIVATMGFAAIPSFLMVETNASKEKTSRSSGFHLTGFSSNRVTSGPSYPSIHSTRNGGKQKPGLRTLRISKGYQKRVKYRPMLNKTAPVASKKVQVADFMFWWVPYLRSADEGTREMEWNHLRIDHLKIRINK